MKGDRNDIIAPIVLVTSILLISYFIFRPGFDFNWDKDDSSQGMNYSDYRFDYSVEVVTNNNSSYSVIVPYPMNCSEGYSKYNRNFSYENITLEELNPEPPELTFINSSGQYELVDTIYGKGLQIQSNESVEITGHQHLKLPHFSIDPRPMLSLVQSRDRQNPYYAYTYNFSIYCQDQVSSEAIDSINIFCHIHHVYGGTGGEHHTFEIDVNEIHIGWNLVYGTERVMFN